MDLFIFKSNSRSKVLQLIKDINVEILSLQMQWKKRSLIPREGEPDFIMNERHHKSNSNNTSSTKKIQIQACSQPKIISKKIIFEQIIRYFNVPKSVLKLCLANEILNMMPK
jgi:hypothetical protein